MTRLAVATCLVLGSASLAVAEPAGEDDAPPLVVEPAPGEAEPSARDVEGAPVPGEESGRIDGTESDEPTTKKVVRGVLFVPRVALAAVLAPVRAGVYAYDRYELQRRYMDLFFNDARTFGLYPVASLESGYGVTAGARLVHKDLFGDGERFRATAATGGRLRYIAALELNSGRRFGDAISLAVEGEIERRPEDRFFGIGNEDMAIETDFRQDLMRASAGVDFRLGGGFHLRPAGTISEFELARSEMGPPIDEVYPNVTRVGFDGARYAYGELELRFDTRRAATRWELASMPATGWLLMGFAGRSTALAEGASYSRYGADLQRYIRIGRGPRVIAARAFGEMVTGARDEVPITQLPRLGGTLLRGYQSDRFRDRIAAAGSIEYRWDLSYQLAALMFVDAGRVYSSFDALTFDGMRVGYGVGFELHSTNAFLMRGSIATSRDGGVFFDLSFDPGRDLKPRVERR
jgi:hypothetical protein